MCDYILVFSLVLNNLVIFVQRMLFVKSIIRMRVEPVVNSPCPWVYFHSMYAFITHIAHGEVRVLEILTNIFTIW